MHLNRDKLTKIGLAIVLTAWFVAVMLWMIAACVYFPIIIAQAIVR